MTDQPERLPQTDSEFRSFIRKNQDRLVRHAFFRLGRREEAVDVVQEVMIRIYRDRNRNRHVEKALSYAFRMVYNSCIDRLRKAGPGFEYRDGKEMHDVPDVTNRESEMIGHEEFSRLNRLLDLLPREQAEVLRLRILDEMSFADIAVILKAPVSTIKSRFSYGILKLKTHLTSKKEVNYEMH